MKTRTHQFVTVLAMTIALAAATTIVNAETSPRTGKVLGGSKVVLRERPDDSSGIVAYVKLGVDIKELERQGEWSHVEMPSGRTAWVITSRIRFTQPEPKVPAIASELPHARVTGSSNLSVAPTTTAKAPAVTVTPQTTGAPAVTPSVTATPVPIAGNSKPAKDAQSSAGWLSQAKPDGAPTPQAGAQAAPSPVKFMLYLIPVLVITLFAVRALKALQTKSGEIPVSKKSIVSGFNLIKARKTAGSNIRVVESTSIGTVSLHLVEVKGKTLLLGSSGSNVTMLGDFTETEAFQDQEFGSLLNGYIERPTGKYDNALANQSAVVNTLDTSVRGTLDTMQDSISRSMERAKQFHERYRGESGTGTRTIA